MSSSSRRSALILVLLLGCPAPPASEVQNPVATSELAVPPPSAPPTTTAVATSTARAEGICSPTPSACDGLLGRKEAAALDAQLSAAHKAVIDGQFQDVHALVEEARLQLRRDAVIETVDGADDAASGLKNAMRAVAVDEAAPEARLVLALGVARSFQSSRAAGDVRTRPLLLTLAQITAQAIPSAPRSVAAGAKSLQGAIALERGDLPKARAAYEEATRLEAGSATAWMGLADVLRSEGAFDEAVTAGRTAASLAPDDRGIAQGLEAATRKERLAVAVPDESLLALLPITNAPLAPSAPPPAPCPATVANTKESAKLCQGVADLRTAKTREQLDKGAALVLEGWSQLKSSCMARDAACGTHVAPALAAASRAFLGAGRLAKSIAAGKILLGQEIPGSKPVKAEIALEVADRFFALALFDSAAEFYERHAQDQGANGALALERALLIRIALGNMDAAMRIARATPRGKHDKHDKARWVLAVALGLRALKANEAASAWIEEHAKLLSASGMSERATASLKPDTTEVGRCGPLLGCVPRRLAGETSWSRSAQRP